MTRSCGGDLTGKVDQDSRDSLDLLEHLPQNQNLSAQITEWRGGDKSQHWHSPNTSSPELLGPGKSTKRRPNRACASEDYPSV